MLGQIQQEKRKRGYKIISWEDTVGENEVGLLDEYKITTYSKDGDITTTYDISETANKIRKRYEKRSIK